MTARYLVVAAVAVLVAACGNGAGDDGDEVAAGTPEPQATVTVTETVTAPAGTDDGEGPEGGTDAPADTHAPCDPDDPELVEQAFIFVTSPLPGDTASGSLTVEGCANTFEANVQWRLLGPDGDTVEEGNTTATCGSGCVGDFSFDVDLGAAPSGIATLEVFDTSAQDGSVVHLNAIPIRIGG